MTVKKKVKKVMVDDSVGVINPVHRMRLREEKEDDNKLLPRYVIEVEEDDDLSLIKGAITAIDNSEDETRKEEETMGTEHIETSEEMKKRVLDIFDKMFKESDKKAKEKSRKMPGKIYLREAQEDDKSIFDRIAIEDADEEDEEEEATVVDEKEANRLLEERRGCRYGGSNVIWTNNNYDPSKTGWESEWLTRGLYTKEFFNSLNYKVSQENKDLEFILHGSWMYHSGRTIQKTMVVTDLNELSVEFSSEYAVYVSMFTPFVLHIEVEDTRSFDPFIGKFLLFEKNLNYMTPSLTYAANYVARRTFPNTYDYLKQENDRKNDKFEDNGFSFINSPYKEVLIWELDENKLSARARFVLKMIDNILKEEKKRYEKNNWILQYDATQHIRNEYLHTILSAMFNYQIGDDMFNKIIEHTLEEAIMNMYFTGEFDETMVKKYDKTPLCKGWYSFYA